VGSGKKGGPTKPIAEAGGIALRQGRVRKVYRGEREYPLIKKKKKEVDPTGPAIGKGPENRGQRGKKTVDPVRVL